VIPLSCVFGSEKPHILGFRGRQKSRPSLIFSPKQQFYWPFPVQKVIQGGNQTGISRQKTTKAAVTEKLKQEREKREKREKRKEKREKRKEKKKPLKAVNRKNS